MIVIITDQDWAALVNRVIALQNAVSHLTGEVQAMSQSFQDVDQALQQLEQDVQKETDIDQSAVTLIQGIPAMIQQAVQQALAAGATADQLKALTDLSRSIEVNADDLASAVTAGTSGGTASRMESNAQKGKSSPGAAGQPSPDTAGSSKNRG